MDLARAPRRAPLTARKKGSGYENADHREKSSFDKILMWHILLLVQMSQDSHYQAVLTVLSGNY